MNGRVIAGVFAMLLVAAPALAQPGLTPVQPPSSYAPPAPTMVETEQYGTTIALIDGASVAAAFVGLVLVLEDAFSNNRNDGNAPLGAILMIGGAAGYTFGGPLVHNHHGNTSGAGKSLALRLGLPLVGGLIGATLDGRSCYESCDDYGPQLTTLGLVSAMVIDWFVLAKKEVRVAAPVVPYAAPVRGGGVTFGLGGGF